MVDDEEKKEKNMKRGEAYRRRRDLKHVGSLRERRAERRAERKIDEGVAK